MSYLSLKALHVVSVISWMAGLLYIVRLFVYHSEAFAKNDKTTDVLHDQFSIMERRLMFGIVLPAAFLSLVTGVYLIIEVVAFKQHWFHLKALLIVLLLAYTHLCGKWRKQLFNKSSYKSSLYFRIQNEVSTLLMVGIVFSAITKEIMPALNAMGIFSALVIVIMYKMHKKTKAIK